MLEPEIHGVRARLDGGAQLGPVAGGTHDFRFTEGGHGTTTSVASEREYDMAGTINLYQAVGRRGGVPQTLDGVLRPSGARSCAPPVLSWQSFRCAIEAFSAFLAQFLGGPSADSQFRWFLSLRESHQRFKIGPEETGCVDGPDDQGPR